MDAWSTIKGGKTKMKTKMSKCGTQQENCYEFLTALGGSGAILTIIGIALELQLLKWIGAFLVVEALIAGFLDVIGILTMLLPAPFLFWYIEKMNLGRSVEIVSFILYHLVAAAVIICCVKLYRLKKEKETTRRVHFTLRRIGRKELL